VKKSSVGRNAGKAYIHFLTILLSFVSSAKLASNYMKCDWQSFGGVVASFPGLEFARGINSAVRGVDVCCQGVFTPAEVKCLSNQTVVLLYQVFLEELIKLVVIETNTSSVE
jgi:hypothetical protein